jgi:hypothetical protein
MKVFENVVEARERNGKGAAMGPRKRSEKGRASSTPKLNDVNPA